MNVKNTPEEIELMKNFYLLGYSTKELIKMGFHNVVNTIQILGIARSKSEAAKLRTRKFPLLATQKVILMRKNRSKWEKKRRVNATKAQQKNRKRIKLVCPVCQKEFERCPSTIKVSNPCCSKKCVGVLRMTGNRNINWKGGISLEENYQPFYKSQFWKLLRQKVWKRDKFICQNCGAQNCKLDAHHIIPLRFGGSNKMNNLVTLCKKCHQSDFHPSKIAKLYNGKELKDGLVAS